jgi:serpin B
MRVVKNYALLLGIAWVVLGAAGLATAEPAAGEATEGVRGNAPFALDLYARLKASEGNVCLSPTSLFTALSMTLAGARGRTETQMAEVLHVGLPPDHPSGAFPDLGDDRQLLLANALWGQHGFDLRDEFLAVTRERYRSTFQHVDFVNGTERARETINGWIAARTEQAIDKLLVEGDLDPGVVLVLTSAVYFKGLWKFPFDAARTVDDEFHLGGGRQVLVPFMQQPGRLPFASFAEADLLELPYEGGRFAMVLLLPAVGDDLSSLEASLTTRNLSRWLDGLSETLVSVRLPRFGIDTRFDLTETLQAIGMVDAFTERADFSGMSATNPLFISKVVHQARVEVDESGTEGASGSGVAIGKGPRPKEFTANRPFVFLIRDRSTGNVLFLGRVANPAP